MTKARIGRACALLIASSFTLASVAAAQIFTDDEAGFRAALTESYTLANLDEPPLDVDNDVPAGDAQFLSIGIDIRSPTTISDGQAFQIPKPDRDRLLANGLNSGVPSFRFNFLSPQNGVGALPNLDDGGVIRAYSGLDLTGDLIAEVPFGGPVGGASGAFGGVVTSREIRSVEITCDFNFDLRCGIYDIQFGTAAPLPVPSLVGPAALVLVFGLAWVGAMTSRSPTAIG